MRKVEAVICARCGKEFEKPISEVKRNSKLGRPNYCSLSCSSKVNFYKNVPEDKRIHLNNLNAGNRKDEFTGLREFIRRANGRKHEVAITNEYLKEIWDKQKGICAYTGIQLILPVSKRRNDHIYTASLDRIDSSKGYIVGNVQFVSTAINCMKSTMSDEQTKELIRLIKNS